MLVAPAPSPRGPERPTWLISFADLIALLLAFFVLIYAMQRVETGPWEALVESLSLSLRPDHDARPPKRAADDNINYAAPPRAIDLSYLEVLLTSRQAREGALAGVLLRRRGDHLIIALPSDLIFASGRATPIAADGLKLADIAAVLRNINNRIEIYGHTDPSQIRSGRFRSNWELSLARAVVVADQLRKFGYRRPIATFGFADTRFGEVASVEPRARRLALARRVDIVIRSTRDTKR